ncbi:MAG: quaternary ammonium compound efflux SMR transporter SugE [Deltaproteobacteria bacterium]|nr:quaternary ammonium compound efflux SMR transporter SugE [Deltaproteobacteria bacterium]
MSSWLILVVAGLCEVVWALALKSSHGFTRLGPSLLTVGAMAASVLLLSWALRDLAVGTAYAVWTGIGAAGTAVMGMILLGEPVLPWRLFCLGLIVAGIVGLKMGPGS